LARRRCSSWTGPAASPPSRPTAAGSSGGLSETETGGAQVWAGPLLVDDSILLVGSDGNAVFMDPAIGEVEETLRLGERPVTPPVVSGGRLYLVRESGRMMVYE
jgi:hypothetical protein